MRPARIEVTADGDVLLDGDAAHARRLPDAAGRVRVALTYRTTLRGGDDVRTEVVVAPGRRLELVETGGTAAPDMHGGRATWVVDVRLGEHAVLVWPSLPVVVADGADVQRLTHVDLAAGARVVLRETLVLGRPGQGGGRVRTTVRSRLADASLLRETFVAEPAGTFGALDPGGPRSLDTVLVLGARLTHPGALQLDGPGTVLRTLARTPHGGLCHALAAAVEAVTAPSRTAPVHAVHPRAVAAR